MAERRKKTRVRDDGDGAAGENPRRGEVRPKPDSQEHPDPQQDSRSVEQDRSKSAPAQGSSPEGPQIALPGKFYQRAGRWWWRIKLPGENKARARPLKPEGAKAAVGDCQTAAKIAFEMWERAVQENAIQQIRLESTEKIERLKAQFLDKVRHFTELVETANAKIEAETKARAEAEARLAQMAQGPEMRTLDSMPKMEAEELPAPPSEVPVGEMENTTPATAHSPLEVGVCECCEASDVAVASLKRIDSGQLLCPRCVAALHADVGRIESAPAE